MSFRSNILGQRKTESIIILDLAAIEVYGVAVGLTFTPPILEGIIKYAVYLDGMYYSDILKPGDFVIFTDVLTDYLIKIVPVTSGGEDVFSNEISVTTGANSFSGYNYEAEYEAMLNEAILKGKQIPSIAQRATDNQRIINFKTEGIFNSFDLFYYFNNDYPELPMDVNFYTLNWVNPTAFPLIPYDITEPPIFIKNLGMNFPAEASGDCFFQSNWNLKTDSVNYKLDDASIIWKSPDHPIETGNIAVIREGTTAGNLSIQMYSSNRIMIVINDTLSSYISWDPAINIKSHIHLSRNLSIKKAHFDGVYFGQTALRGEDGMSNATMNIPAHNYNGINVNNARGWSLNYWLIGSALESKQDVIYQILNDIY